MSRTFRDEAAAMQRALELARLGLGAVEPNPAVGAVVTDDDLQLLGEGYHARFGGPHAEVVALEQAGERSRGATLYVTLEPCSHFGKTPPCAPLVISSGVRRVVIGASDPAPHVSGAGIRQLRAAGVEVEIGLLANESARLIAPFRKWQLTRLPYVHAKWAMTLDGKLAARTGDSRWISSKPSREVVHQLRGRMDAVVIGVGTAVADDPLLTARPPGPRTAARIVIDPHARLPLESKLIQTTAEAPVLIAVAEPEADGARAEALRTAGAEVFGLPELPGGRLDLAALLRELGRRSMTNVLIEGGGTLLGTCFDAGVIDEYHIFIAPLLIGGKDAVSPLCGEGREWMREAARLEDVEVERIDGDVYIHGIGPGTDA